MEVSVASMEGIPPGSMLSVRAGGFKRQRTLNKALSEPFVFHGELSAAKPLQVDILVPCATSGDLSDLGPGQHTVNLHRADNSTMAEPMSLQVNVSSMSSSGGTNRKTPTTTGAVQRYMDDHLLKDKLTHALMRLLREQPEDPMVFLSRSFCAGDDFLKELIADVEKDVCNSDGKTDYKIKQETTASEMAGDAWAKHKSSQHVLPLCVSKGSPTRLVDFGSGETGFNTYSLDDDGEKLVFKGCKRKAPFFAAFVEPDCVADFAGALIEEFDLLSDMSSEEIRIFAGATGIHRDMIGHPTQAKRAHDFLSRVGNMVSSQLGRQTTIKLFVPSGLLEAQFELAATEWLVGRSSLFHISDFETESGAAELSEELIQEAFNRLDCNDNGFLNKEDLQIIEAGSRGQCDQKAKLVKKAVSDLVQSEVQVNFEQFRDFLKRSLDMQMAVQMLIFSGTISAGGGSSQLSIMSGQGGSSLQHFSAKVGNKLPILEGIFSKSVLESERETWRARVRSELRQSKFPTGVRGLYVGISAVYHAMRVSGMTDRVLRLSTACDALEESLRKVDPEAQQTIANVILVVEFLRWVFDESAAFIFKREWKTRDGEFVSTWTLGMFTQQLCAQAVQDEKMMRRGRFRSVARATQILSHMAAGISSHKPSYEREAAMDRLFEIPFVAWPLFPAYILDLGSGEVGTYNYASDFSTSLIRSRKSTKIPEPFFDGFVAKERVGDFVSMLISEFELVQDKKLKRDIIFGGATGLHREMLLAEREKRELIFEFISRAELELERRMHRKTSIRLFVPSGDLEAQYELRAVQWLIGLPDVDIETSVSIPAWMVDEAWKCLHGSDGGNATGILCETAKAKLASAGVSDEDVALSFKRADTNGDEHLSLDEFAVAAACEPMFQALVRRCTFSGTISAGGGSSQLTLASTSRNSISQLFSAPVGNRVPIVQQLFGKEVSWEERSTWIGRIREALRIAEFPTGLGGFFVGISAMYHAAKAAGIADRLVSKRDAVNAVATKLSKLDASDQRNIANLTLVKEIVDWVFADDVSMLLFKRNWSTPSATYVAGWTLGMYAMQFEGDEETREGAVCTIQRCARGRQVRNRLLRANSAKA